MNIERDRFLTEAMGECYHTADLSVYVRNNEVRCRRCKTWQPIVSGSNFAIRHDDFSLWSGFGKLWMWVQEQEWFGAFCTKYSNENLSKFWRYDVYFPIIHPDRFADAVYKFLKGQS